MKTTELLDAVKAAKGITTDYALAKELGLPTQRISDYYKGRGTRYPDEFTCLQIARALGRDYAEVQAAVRIEAEKDESRREVWRDYFKSISRQAAATALSLLFVILSSTPAPAEAARLASIALIVAGIVGLKLLTPDGP